MKNLVDFTQRVITPACRRVPVGCIGIVASSRGLDPASNCKGQLCYDLYL
jgi:hypothetical protein